MRRCANFSYDRRGWKNLYAHALDQLQKQEVDPSAIELNLNGNPITGKEDVAYLKKLLALFSEVRSIFLRKCHLQSQGELSGLGEILCTRLLRCKRLDFAGNRFTAEVLSPFLGMLDGRSQTKSVCPFWLALGDGMAEELLTRNAAFCDPMSPTGCICQSKRSVHVVRWLRSKAFQDALTKKLPAVFSPVPPPDTLSRRAIPSEASDENPPPATPLPSTATMLHKKALPPVPEGRFPPPPSMPPPPVPLDLERVRDIIASISTKIAKIVDQQRDLGHVISVEDNECMLVNLKGKYCVVDPFSTTVRGEMQLRGEKVKVCDVDLIMQPGDMMVGKAEAYFAKCETPDSYLATKHDDIVQFRITSYDSGYVAATFPNLNEWKWFPLSKLSVVEE